MTPSSDREPGFVWNFWRVVRRGREEEGAQLCKLGQGHMRAAPQVDRSGLDPPAVRWRWRQRLNQETGEEMAIGSAGDGRRSPGPVKPGRGGSGAEIWRHRIRISLKQSSGHMTRHLLLYSTRRFR